LTADETNAKLLEDANKTNVGNELKSRAENRRMLSGDEKLALEKRKLDITEKYNNARIENLQKPTNRVLRTVDDVNAAIKEVQSKIPGMSDADALTYIETRIGAASSYNPTNAGIRTQVNEDVKNSPANVAAEVSRTAALEKAKLDAAETAKQEFVAPIIEQLNSLGDDPTKGIIRSESFGSLPKATQEIILRNPGFKIPNPISSKAPEQFAIGRAALNHVTSVEELLKDPEIKQNLGALSGRISLAKQFIGGDPYGGKDSNEWKAGNVDPIQIDMQGLDPNSKMARFLTDVSNLLNWEVKNIAGNRPAHQLFDRLQKNAPSVVAGEFTNLGRLQGVKDGIVNAMKGFAGITTSTEKKKSFSEMLEEVK
jgi:hypothetical protein